MIPKLDSFYPFQRSIEEVFILYNDYTMTVFTRLIQAIFYKGKYHDDDVMHVTRYII